MAPFRGIHMLLTLAVWTPGLPAWATPPPAVTCPFEDPLQIGPARIEEVSCGLVDGLPEDGGCSYEIDLPVVHRAADGTITYDGVSFGMNGALIGRVEQSFCDVTPLALQRIVTAIEQSGVLEAKRLGRAASVALRRMRGRIHYRVQSHVHLTLQVERCVSRLADHFYRRRRKPLVITSGTRFPDAQASAMYSKLVRRARYRNLYRKREAAEEIRQTFLAARRVRPRLPRAEVIARMAATIRQQMQQGVYVSEHLREGAVDLRSRNLSRGQKLTLQGAARELLGLTLNREERIPPHFHLQVDGSDPRCGEPKARHR